MGQYIYCIELTGDDFGISQTNSSLRPTLKKCSPSHLFRFNVFLSNTMPSINYNIIFLTIPPHTLSTSDKNQICLTRISPSKNHINSINKKNSYKALYHITTADCFIKISSISNDIENISSHSPYTIENDMYLIRTVCSIISVYTFTT